MRNLKIWKVNEYESLLSIFSLINLTGNNDQPLCNLNNNGSFMVKSYYNHWSVKVAEHRFPFMQNEEEQPAQNCFLCLGGGEQCILTIDKLMRRGKITVNGCYICKMKSESCNHILFWCLFAYKSWIMIYGLLGISREIVGLVVGCAGKEHRLDNWKPLDLWQREPLLTTAAAVVAGEKEAAACGWQWRSKGGCTGKHSWMAAASATDKETYARTNVGGWCSCRDGWTTCAQLLDAQLDGNECSWRILAPVMKADLGVGGQSMVAGDWMMVA